MTSPMTVAMAATRRTVSKAGKRIVLESEAK